MDWARAIERNRDALNGIVASLFAMLGLEGGGAVARIPRELHRAVLSVLRPAESAVRRLIVIAARGITVKLAPSRPMPKGRIAGQGGSPRTSFQLFDPRKRFALAGHRVGVRVMPRIRVFSFDPRLVPLWSRPEPVAVPAQPPETEIGAERLCRRLNALKLALEDLPRQARRLARWRARRQKLPSLKFKSPLRPGRPPGHRRKPVHEVDEVLVECHGLARDALLSDTS